ncbi:MAG: 1-deoxy-D-xylulose-5-phosphate reductoisomerase, partial [Planctomycetales bacterium]|nr:1-deoxy-D-xylulose-5-phosphate reductoisomerase [Planctomycetales bacterium]
VEFVDGSVIAQLSPPDMKLPIQYALTYPERRPCPATDFDWTQTFSLQLEPPDFERFPALELGLDVARRGGTAGVVVNAANEAAVDRFMAGDLRFDEIVPACRDVLHNHHFDSSPSLDDLFRWDRWAREEIQRWIYT